MQELQTTISHTELLALPATELTGSHIHHIFYIIA